MNTGTFQQPTRVTFKLVKLYETHSIIIKQVKPTNFGHGTGNPADCTAVFAALRREHTRLNHGTELCRSAEPSVRTHFCGLLKLIQLLSSS